MDDGEVICHRQAAGGGRGGSQEPDPEAVDRDSAPAPGAQRAAEST